MSHLLVGERKGGGEKGEGASDNNTSNQQSESEPNFALTIFFFKTSSTKVTYKIALANYKNAAKNIKRRPWRIYCEKSMVFIHNYFCIWSKNCTSVFLQNFRRSLKARFIRTYGVSLCILTLSFI